MAYTPQTWANGQVGGTPLSATRLSVMEAGIAAAALLAEDVHTVATAGTALTIDLSLGTIWDIGLSSASCALTLPTPVAGRSFLLRPTQDATGGRLLTYVGTVKWPGGASPTLTATANAQDLISFVSITGAAWNGLPAGYDLR